MVIPAADDIRVECIGKDLGNGFDKETIDGINVTVEQAVYAEPETDFFQITTDDDQLVSVNKGNPIYIGEDAVESGFPIKSALGESDSQRYYSTEYKNLLFGSIGKRLMANAVINMLVLGLPNKHYTNEKIREDLKEMVKGKQIVQKGQVEMILDIRNSFVMPQPAGTIVYLDSEGKEFPGLVLVCDGGYGTFDLAVMKGTKVIEYRQKDKGMKVAYKEIATILESTFDGKEFAINEIPYILANGFTYGRRKINPVFDVPKVAKIMDEHFEEMYSFIIDCFYNPARFDAIIWTGGVAPAHHDRILAMDEKSKAHNAIVLQDGQKANAIGFYEFGMGILESEF